MVCIGLITLTGCTGSKWTKDISAMPEEQKAQHLAAVEEKLTIIDEVPTDSGAHFELAFHYEALGEYKDAVKIYKQTLELDPGHIVAMNNVAGIYEEVGDYEEAAMYIKRLYELRPAIPEVIKDTIRILLKAGETENAQAALENFASIASTQGSQEMNDIASDLFKEIVDYKNNNK